MIFLDLNILKAIDEELCTYKNLSKVEIFNICINNRLAATLRKYNEEVDATSEFLLKQSSSRVLKALTKMQKFDDKDIIKKYMEEDVND